MEGPAIAGVPGRVDEPCELARFVRPGVVGALAALVLLLRYGGKRLPGCLMGKGGRPASFRRAPAASVKFLLSKC